MIESDLPGSRRLLTAAIASSQAPSGAFHPASVTCQRQVAGVLPM
jgi:hypothetical protein